MDLKPGIYKNYRGDLYKVITVAKLCGEGVPYVTYQALYGDCEIWTRPLDVFCGMVNGVKRMELFDISTLDYYYDKIALLVIRDKRVLMARNKDREFFYMPGGKRDDGETDVQCLVRECREELGIEVDPKTAHLYGVYSAFAYADKPCARLTIYQANFSGTPTPSSEVEELGWIGYEDRKKAIGSGRTLLDELYWKGLID
jgi:8-oxo-dGTP pyrophosphatase MutT (NUDIX family)